ncbi:hypothetical protein C9374_005269 [Naegleria lovaniensis]|uniref:Kinesin motor domain-containing protein n=1 Tax=Naegleria lovaniensis TaxID=51637 RepID=A0AA88GP78_NAELO|nr:uncharacterized protein C9374_005269 [Naegleria lovaniensis]KAG2382689.1 hypothetical protein C9374_005269 [Naegleria lovaniensis]
MNDESDKKAQCSVAFHKSLKNVLLKYGVEKPMKYDFDKVFPMSTTTEQIFESIGLPMLNDIINTGCNNVLISCGGKYSGRSFSIVGGRNWENEEIGPNDALLFRSVKFLLDHKYSLSLSVSKVRNGSFVDLMKKNATLDDTQLISEVLSGVTTDANSIFKNVLYEILVGSLKVVVLANCSPHVSAAEVAKKTMDITTSFSVVKADREHVTTSGNTSHVAGKLAKNNEEILTRLRMHHIALKESCTTLRREKDEMRNLVASYIQHNIETFGTFLLEELEKRDRYERAKQNIGLEEKDQQLKTLHRQVVEKEENEQHLKEKIEKLLHDQSINKDVASRLLVEKEESLKNTVNELVENHAVQIAEITENWEHEKRLRLDMERYHHAEISKLKQEFTEKVTHFNSMLKEKQEQLDRSVNRVDDLENQITSLEEKIRSEHNDRKTISDRSELLTQQVSILEQALLESKEKQEKLAITEEEAQRYKNETAKLLNSLEMEQKKNEEAHQERLMLQNHLIGLEEKLTSLSKARSEEARKHELEVKELKAKLIGLEKALELGNTEMESSMKLQLEQKEKDLKEKEAQCDHLSHTVYSLKEKIAEIELSRRTGEERESSLQEKLDEAYSQINRSKERIALLESDIDSKCSTLRELESKNSESLQQLLQLQSALTERGNVILNMDKELKIQKHLNTELKMEIESKNNKIQELEQSIKGGSTKIASISDEINSLREMNNVAKENIAKLTSEKSMLEQQVNILKQDCTSSNNQLVIEKNNLELEKSKLELAYQQTVDATKKQSEKLQTLSARVLELERLLIDKNNELKNLQTTSQSADQRYNDLLFEFNKIKEEDSIQLNEKDRMISSLVQKSTDLTKKLAEYSIMDQRKNDLEKENSMLKEEILSLSKEKDIILVEQESLSKLILILNKSIDELRKEKNILHSQMMNVKEDCSTLHVEKINYYESQIQTLATENKNLLDVLEKQKEDLDAHQNRALELERKLRQSEKTELSNKDSELRNSKTLCSESITAIKKLELSVQERDKEIFKIKKELEKKNSLLLEKDNTERQSSEQLQPETSSTSSEVTQLRNELEHTKTELESVKDKLHCLSSEQKKNQILIDISTKPTSKEKILSTYKL